MSKKSLLFSGIILSLGLSLVARAGVIDDVFLAFNQSLFEENFTAPGYDWKVGDSTNYKLSAGFIKGTMVMSVKALTPELLTLSQELDLGMAGKKSCQMTVDPNTGETKTLVCDGKEEKIPGKDDMEIIEVKEESVTVPAGTFTCLHVSMKQKKDGKLANQWVSPKLVPVMGLIKMDAPSSMGKVTMELTSFKKMP